MFAGMEDSPRKSAHSLLRSFGYTFNSIVIIPEYDRCVWTVSEECGVGSSDLMHSIKCQSLREGFRCILRTVSLTESYPRHLTISWHSIMKWVIHTSSLIPIPMRLTDIFRQARLMWRPSVSFMSAFYFVARYGGLATVIISCLPVGLRMLWIKYAY